MAWVNLLDVIYPVGSIYWSTLTASPAETIGGSWSQFTGTYLKCEASPGTTGGTLEHSHTLSSKGGACIDVGANSSFSAIIVAHKPGAVQFTPQYKRYWNASGGTASEDFKTTVALTGETDSTGLQPPFTTVCAWKRIA